MTTKKKTTKKIITKRAIEDQPEVKEAKKLSSQQASPPKKGCIFCRSKTAPHFIDASSLRSFLTDRGRIMPKVKTNLCSKHQRAVARQIKYARHLALLPFTPKV